MSEYSYLINNICLCWTSYTIHLIGTGKTITGVHTAYWFAEINRRNTPRERPTPAEEIPEKAPPQVLYCGPSNKSVDVVAGVNV